MLTQSENLSRYTFIQGTMWPNHHIFYNIGIVSIHYSQFDLSKTLIKSNVYEEFQYLLPHYLTVLLQLTY